MNQEESLDLLSEVEIPQWMMQNIDRLQESSIFLESNNHLNLNESAQNSVKAKKQNTKQYSPLSYQLNGYSKDKSSESSSEGEEEKKFNQKISPIAKKESKNKQQRRNQTSRKYRERKRQHTKNLESENSFLRFKVDELTFRLHEVTTELNKLKNNSQQQNIPNYHQLENALQNNIEDEGMYQEIEKKLSSVMSFDGKQKIDLLNYFMSQLMQNVINSKSLYMIDCLINKKGVHRPNESVKLSPMDVQIFDILDLWNSEKQTIFKQLQWQKMVVQCKKFREYWKKLYQVYLAILNQGFRTERMIDTFRKKVKDFVKVKDMLRLELYFQKNKYRLDIRELRSLWFRELERQKIQLNKQQIASSRYNQNIKQ